MRISDWSSDVCSSDLVEARPQFHQGGHRLSRLRRLDQRLDDGGVVAGAVEGLLDRDDAGVARGLLQEHHYRVEARSEEHTSELQSLMRISYAVFCLKKKKTHKKITYKQSQTDT